VKPSYIASSGITWTVNLESKEGQFRRGKCLTFVDRVHLISIFYFCSLIIHFLEEGKLDGLSLVFNPKSDSWGKVGDVPELRAVMQEIAREEESRLKYLESVPVVEQVFDNSMDAEANQIPTLPVPKKYLTTDDGKRYVWDDEENDWVENEDASSSSDDSDDENEDEAAPGKGKEPVLASGEKDLQAPAEQSSRKRKKKKKSKKKTGDDWSNSNASLWVYVTGLPSDVTVEEVKAHFSKASI
jgi:hypothetical protein